MGLYKNMLKEPVTQLNLREAVTVLPGVTVRDVVRLLRERKLGCVIVTDEDNRPLGLFTEAILRKLIVDDLAALDDPVQDHMARQVPRVRATDPVVFVLEAMKKEKHRFVCVLNDDGTVKALTGQKGLMEYIAEHFPHALYTQRVRTHPPRHQREGA